ncbi:MAG TPA: Hsp20/alpha crystallin family protein [Anaerolineaceae bacterium]|nr:Hsp20/alpha crystallin family protein [Anaerolineaceae bacterium]
MSNSEFPVHRPFRGNRLALRPLFNREGETPMLTIQNEMNRMFDEFFSDAFSFPGQFLTRRSAEFFPRMDISETETEFKVSAELPGMDEKDIHIKLEKDVLKLCGEKKSAVEEKENTYHRVERSYGSFERVIPFNTQLDEDKVSAVFKNGVLTVTLPKAKEVIKTSRTITINPS